MAKDVIGYIAREFELEEECQHENGEEGSVFDSSRLVASDGCSTKIIGGEKVKLRTLMFSRSAETVGCLGAGLKQTAQRPDRLHARRSSASRRAGVAEQNPTGLKYAPSKTIHRNFKANVRTSKSCTKECEVVRVDYTNDLSPPNSAFYEDILAAADESDTFTGLGADAEGFENEDVSLSESTALVLDNGELEAKSDVTITSREDASSSIIGDNVVQNSSNDCDSGHERPGACRYRPNIDSSDESLDSDVSDRQHIKGRAAMGSRHKPLNFGSWIEEDHIRAMKLQLVDEADVRLTSSEQINTQLQINKDRAQVKKSQKSAESTRVLESAWCVQESSVTQVYYAMNKDLVPASDRTNGNIASLKDTNGEDTQSHTNLVTSSSYIPRVSLENDQEKTRSSLSKYEMFLVMNQPDDSLLSRSSSRLSLPRNRTTPLSQSMCEKLQDVSHHARLIPCHKKRTPSPEELVKAVTEAFNSGQFHFSQMITANTDIKECLLEENESGKVNIDKHSENDDINQVNNLSEHSREMFGYDSPGISILSFSLVKEISDSAMPQRRDHNDVILGDTPSVTYSASRPGTRLTPTPELLESISREAPKNACSSGLSASSPLRSPAAANISDKPSTCKRVNDKNDMRVSFCSYTCIETYPQIPEEYTPQKPNSTTESSQRNVNNEMGYGEDCCDRMAGDDTEDKKSTLKLEETGELNLVNVKPYETMAAPAMKSTAKCLIKSSVPPLGSHEYLPFLNKLRQEKPAKKEATRQQKGNKSQRKVDSGKKNTTPQEDDCHGDDESVGCTPLCPVGHEVPADWKPGEHASHPLTKLSAIYTPVRKVKRRRSIRKKRRVQNRLSPRKRDKEVVAAELTRHTSQFEVNVRSPPNALDASKSCLVMQAHEAGSTDTDANPEDEVLASFEYKRRYYERLSKMVKDDSGSDSKGENSPNPKRVTSQVRLLKTLDELYSSDSSSEAEGELPYTDQPLFDVGHQASLFNYYTSRLKNMAVLGNIAEHEEPETNKMPYIRIRKVEQEVPSTLDHKRLKSLYECRMRKPTLTSKARKVDNTEHARSRFNDKTDGLVKISKQTHVTKGYSRSPSTAQNLPKIANNKGHSHDKAADTGDAEMMGFKERLNVLDKAKTTYDPYCCNAPHRSYLDILKSNIYHPSVDTKHLPVEYHPYLAGNNPTRQNALNAEVTFGKESARQYIEERDRKSPPLRERESVHRARMKVRFADPGKEHKDRVPYEMSDEDTWCSTVNAMLLRANRVMDDVNRNDHRYPKPDSARVVSPVPPKSPTFLKELLKQDTIERKQAKGNCKLERRCKELAVKSEKPNARPIKPPAQLPLFTAPGPSSFLAIDQRADTYYTQNNSSLIYSVPIKDGTEQASVNDKSAGVLKISIQMSKRAQERAWLTHERIKRQRATNIDNDIKSEINAIPKKLTPLRISKPINFQNPDSRNLDRISMRDVLSKALLGQSTSSQQIFQPKTTAAESLTTNKSNFLLDQHSETFRYFRGPYMHQRSTSIVPLYSDSNNNAYLRGDAQVDEFDEASEDHTQRSGDDHALSQDVFDEASQDESPRSRDGLAFSQCVFNEASQEVNQRSRDDLASSQDVVSIPQMSRTVPESESLDCRCSCEEQSSSLRYTVHSPRYCYNDYSSNKNEQSTESNKNEQSTESNKNEQSTESNKNEQSTESNKNEQSTESNAKNYNTSKTVTSVNEFIAGIPWQSMNRSADTPDNLINSYPDSKKSSHACDDERSSSGTDTPLSCSSNKYITIADEGNKTNEEAIKSNTISASTNTPRKVYISGMPCFEIVENDNNLKKLTENNEATEYSRNVFNEQREAIEKQLDSQETLLDVLLGYEFERMSKVALRIAEADTIHSQPMNTHMDNENAISKPSVSVNGMSELCSTRYLNQWAPNYLDTEQQTEQSVTAAIQEVDQTSSQVGSDEVDNEQLRHQSCTPTSNEADNFALIPEYRESSVEKVEFDIANETIRNIVCKLHNPHSTPKPKPQKARDDTPTFNNLTILGSTIALAEKHSHHVSINIPAHSRVSSYTLPASRKLHSSQVREKPSLSSKLDSLSLSCKRSFVREMAVEKPINEPTLVRPARERNKLLERKPENNMKQNKKTHEAQKQAKKTTNLRAKTTTESILYADACVFLGHEDYSMNKTYCKHFDWTTVKVPPAFIKGRNLSLDTITNEITSRAEDLYSSRSVYSISPAAGCTEEDTADVLDSEEVSKCRHTPNVFDWVPDPPNSACTTINRIDMRSSASITDAEKDNKTHAAGSDNEAHGQSHRKDTMDKSNTPETIDAALENISPRAGYSDINRERVTLSRMTVSCLSPGGISHITDSFDEDEDEKPAPNEEATDDALEWKSESEDVAFKDLVAASQYDQWRAIGEKLKLNNDYMKEGIHVPARSTLRSSSLLRDRDFLKSLRNTDLLHTVSMDKQRLLKSLQLMTRRKGYLPMFQVKTNQVIEMMPQIVVLNHCAKTFIERGSSSFSATVRCLPIFYTEDNRGFITSIYTVNWIPEGVYSIDKSPMETASSGELKANLEQQASFGKLLQYSPFASDLAFSNDQAYLIGDEVNSREQAAKTLTVVHDDAGGNVAQYFMLMCGWVPPHLNSTAIPPTEENAPEEKSKKWESSERGNSCIQKLTEVAQYHSLEQHPPEADSMYSEKNLSKTAEEKMTSLPHITASQMSAKSDNHSVVFEPHSGQVCKLPDICKNASMISPEKAPPTVMLCLRCGVTVECAQAQTDDVPPARDEIPEEKWQTRKVSPMNTNITTSHGLNSPSCCRRRSCHHRWEVSEVGLALPLLTTVTRRVPSRRIGVRDRTPPLHSTKVQRHSKLSLKRTTKSQTEFECRNQFDWTIPTLPQVRSQPDIHGARYCFKSIDAPAHVFNQIEEYAHRNMQPVGKGLLPQFTPDNQRLNYSIEIQGMDSDKKDNVLEEPIQSESLFVGNKRKTPTRINDLNPGKAQKSPATVQRRSISPRNQKGLKLQTLPGHQAPNKQSVSFKQQAYVKGNRLKEVTQPAPIPIEKEKPAGINPSVAGWTWNTLREAVEEEQDLMVTRTWSQPVIPPPFPIAESSTKKKHPQKTNNKGFQSRKKHMAQHRRNLNQINQSYVSPYWAKKEIKRVRSKTPVSDSGDDGSSISRITTNSGLSSSSSESHTEEESSTDESECESGSSDSGSDFFTRYANKGGPTSVDDIFKRTLPRQKLDFKLARLKEAKEKEEIEQLGYLRGREGITPPVQDHGDNAKENDHGVSFVLSEYDMCSDVDEIKELWKQCFPEVDFWDRKRRKKFKKTKILS